MKPTQEMTADTKPTVQLKGRTTLVKFYFSNKDHIPAGIEEKSRQPDEVIDFGRHHTTKDKKKAAFGRHRPDRVDNGEPTLNNIPKVHPAMIRRGLTANGYRLTNAHWFLRERDGKPDQYVVVLTFNHGADENADLSRKTLDAIRKLSKTIWFCTVWENEEKQTVTVNFAGIQNTDKPSYSIVARGGNLELDAVFAFTEEDAE